MTDTTYFFRLRPLSDFFFGGEQNFGNDTHVVNYRIQSRRFPQQTAVLGMLRLLLLEQSNGMFDKPASVGGRIMDKETAKSLIGSEGFRVNKALDQFGVIEQISPLLLYEGDIPYFKTPLTKGYRLKVDSELVSYAGNADHQLAILMDTKDKAGKTPFSYKNGLEDSFTAANGGATKKGDTVFVKKERIGIQKSYIGKTEDRAFFKQSSYSLKDGFSFGFYATFSKNDVLADTGKTLVFLGGERSRFALDWHTVEAVPSFSLPQNAWPADDLSKICLLSDTYLPQSGLHGMSTFIAGHTTSFRFLETSLDTEKHFNLSGKKNGADAAKSDRYTLLKKGAVIYPATGKEQAWQNMLEGKDNGQVLRFRKIGYNQFCTNTKNNQTTK